MTTSSTAPGQSANTTPTQPAAKTAAASTVATATVSGAKKSTTSPPKTIAKKAPAKPVKRSPTPVPAKAAPAPAPALQAKEVRAKKPKLVRDSFTIPKDEYAVIETLKQRANLLAQPAKKSELLRAGLKVLAGLSDAALRNALQAVPSIKTGRPKAETPAAKPSAKTVRKPGK
ncbi:hypothetical protein [Acidovorax soli]|uniref:hypothetical protein n=1 Tax=Acidovorax TaxID=12916 RepID=UPI0026EB98CB|nr:hypothetical protein [Acidovorax soli]MCM2345677.1 hypothetical protein [Acidovorax soli]